MWPSAMIGAAKANKILGLIRRTFDHLDREMLSQLYRGLVRPHLEYGNLVWSPQYKKDAEVVENVQKRATKMIPELREMEYEERLKERKLPSLIYRRLRGDLIEAYKYLHGLNKVENCPHPPQAQEENREDMIQTRGHDLKLKKLSCNTNVRKGFFSLRVNEWWNSLPMEVAQAPSLNCFKSRVDRHLEHFRYSTEFPLDPRQNRRPR